jgi:hypothetical protein
MPTVNEILKQKVVSYFPSNRRMRISVFRTFFNELIDAITNQTQTILTTMVFLVGPKYKIGSKELLTPNKKQEDFNRWITDVNLAQYNEIQELKSKLACVMSYLNITCSGSSGSGSNSGSGGSGIGGTLLEAWANAKLFNTQSNNGFFCGGIFSNVKSLKYQGNTYIQFNYSNIQSPSAIIIIGLSNGGSINFGDPVALNGSGLITVIVDDSVINPISTLDTLVSVEIVASTYSSGNNALCTSGTITFTP